MRDTIARLLLEKSNNQDGDSSEDGNVQFSTPFHSGGGMFISSAIDVVDRILLGGALDLRDLLHVRESLVMVASASFGPLNSIWKQRSALQTIAEGSGEDQEVKLALQQLFGEGYGQQSLQEQGEDYDINAALKASSGPAIQASKLNASMIMPSMTSHEVAPDYLKPMSATSAWSGKLHVLPSLSPQKPESPTVIIGPSDQQLAPAASACDNVFGVSPLKGLLVASDVDEIPQLGNSSAGKEDLKEDILNQARGGIQQIPPTFSSLVKRKLAALKGGRLFGGEDGGSMLASGKLPLTPDPEGTTGSSEGVHDKAALMMRTGTKARGVIPVQEEKAVADANRSANDATILPTTSAASSESPFETSPNARNQKTIALQQMQSRQYQSINKYGQLSSAAAETGFPGLNSPPSRFASLATHTQSETKGGSTSAATGSMPPSANQLFPQAPSTSRRTSYPSAPTNKRYQSHEDGRSVPSIDLLATKLVHRINLRTRGVQ
ncbi:hypothetical protein CEUSTIGMA_g4633.t1 [Chlamydomonas eustigma]|uniref:Uncharacterized protein n=1 Tax=Chlamydomonas eustigma TaxID=1157962 RepID=A0A250X283_9CHLO|nr:hypothetical protein CEUSTIGMA_g4633.t1 [Chlamydomonas eustigma]|eukprot:GAX77187.1 hypothetical protein CEUSTIGMA_g4633.t1 [Chlamydomonas eustigma]